MKQKDPSKSRKSRGGSTMSDGDPYVTNLLEHIDTGKTLLSLDSGATLFDQGDAADAIYFVQTGKVRLTVTSTVGKEAVLSIVGPRGFVGEGCLVGQSRRVSSATVVQHSTLYCVTRKAMLHALHAQPLLSEKFTASLLRRNIDLEEDLCDQLFNHSEKRLARALLKLARFGIDAEIPEARMPRVSQETLAAMVGTSRSESITS